MLKAFFRFARARSGLAAVEFALLAPMLVTLFFSVVEVTDLMQRNQRVHNMANTTADLAAQSTQITNAAKNNIFAAASAIMYPYQTSGLTIVLSSVIDNGNGGAKVAWSDAQLGSPRAVGSAVSVPAGLIEPGGSVILAEISYGFTPPLTFILGNSWTLTSSFYSHPRRTSQIARVP